MSWGNLKYTSSFKTLLPYHNITGFDIYIYQVGYNSPPASIEVGASTVELSRDAGQFEWVNGTKFTFSLINITEEQYSEFREATYGQYWVLLKDDSANTIFTGYLQSEIYTEDYSDAPYSARLTFTCGLSHLKYVRFDDGSGNLYSGQKSLLEVIRLCLNKLGKPLSIREFMNIYDDSMTSTTTSSLLTQCFVDSNLYREEKDGVEVGFTCARVLEEILKCFNTHLYIWDNVWYFIRWQEYADTTMYYREFLPRVGSESTLTIDSTGNWTTNKRTAGLPDSTSTEMVIVGDSSELSIEPPINRIKLTYNQDFTAATNMQLIQNGCMQILTANNYTGKPTYWSYQGIDPDSYSAIYATGNVKYFQFNNIDSAAYTSSKYIRQTRANLFISTSDTLRIDLKGYQKITINKAVTQANFSIINTFLNGGWYRYYPVQIKIGSYYLRQLGSNSGDWVTTPQVFTITGLGSGHQMPFWVDSFPADISEAFYIITGVLPLSGFQDIEMTFFQPYSNVEPQDTVITDFTMDVDVFGITCASVIYQPDQNAAITDYVVYQEIDEDEEVLDLEIIHGDGLYDFSINSFRLSSGQVTNNWNRRGLTDNKTIFEEILVQYSELRGDFVKNLSATIYTQMKPYNTIEHTVNGNATQYMIKDYSYKLEMDEWTCNLMEIESFTSITPDITTTSRLVNEPQVNPTPVTYDNTQANNIVANSSVIIADQNELNNFL
jgi:hypothetical protein